ncbi:MAG: trehalose-6-phosphate synthase [Dehalococcoidia bacterium]|nr:trehalose-6-phosphate synthase [Dehalococcoidia bacterium]
MARSIYVRHTVEQVFTLCKEVLAEHPLIVVSNRGPVEYQLPLNNAIGSSQPRKRSSTVSTALNALFSSTDFSWVSSAMGEGDRRIAEQAGELSVKPPLPGFRTSLRFVVTPRRAYHKFYNIFCNPLLWFLQHYMWSSPYTPNIDASVYDAWDTGYVIVNQSFADAVVAEAKGLSNSPLVMMHDYHLYLVPGMVRKHLPNAVLHYLIHIPWPTPHIWQLLPANMRNAIFDGLASCDIIGFQSELDAHNFLSCCHTFLLDAEVNFEQGTVKISGHTARVHIYPLAVNAEEVRQIANSPRAQEYEKRMETTITERLIVRVDRAEPNKNVVRGFRAYQLMLQRHPELLGNVKFLAFLAPSRTHIKQYERYLQEIDEVIRDINRSFGKPDWQPIQAFYENNYVQAIAGLRLCDALLVNPVNDGTSLVAKEGPIVSSKKMVLVLSEGSATYDQLKDVALTVSPADIEGTSKALYQAISMSQDERDRRFKALLAKIEQEDALWWLGTQFEDIKALSSRRTKR